MWELIKVIFHGQTLLLLSQLHAVSLHDLQDFKFKFCDYYNKDNEHAWIIRK